MKESEKKENTSVKYLREIAWVGYLSTVIVFGSYFVTYYFKILFNERISGNPEDWSAFGEYIGGILSPILAFLALIALLHSIRLQTTELNHSTEQLKKSAEALDNQNKLIQKQNFEATFFQLLKLYTEIVHAITLSTTINLDPTKKEGRDAIEHIYGKLIVEFFNKNQLNNESDPEKYKTEKYAEFYKGYGQKISHSYRIIYNILKFVSSSNMTYEEQKFYTDILRAQLSKYELALLFYNVFYFQGNGNGNGKMYPWVMQYNIFKHIEKEVILEPDHQKLNQILQGYKAHRHSMDINQKYKTV